MTSHGQRFRRRALRRGYKVDEVDAFLDRVEATMAGETDTPVTAQEVHDVVFRVRFGGYDEWQVDLHLDRVERQLLEAEAQQQASAYGRPPEPRVGGHAPVGPPDRLGPPEHVGAPHHGAAPVPPGPLPPPHPMPPGPMPPGGPMPAGRPGPVGYPGDDPGYGQYDEPTYGGGFDYVGRRAIGDPHDMTTEMRFGDAGRALREPDPAPGYAGGPPAPMRMGATPPPPAPPPPMTAAPPAPPPMGAAPVPPPLSPAVAPRSPVPPGPHHGPSHGPGPLGPLSAHDGPAAADLRRLDELRRSFQPRRYGSGYDRQQVDRLFEQIMAGVAGHGPMPISPEELDSRRFDLVPGGYFEGDVDTALSEVREILRRH